MKTVLPDKPTRAAKRNQHNDACANLNHETCGCCTIHICRKHRAGYARATLKINAEISQEPDFVPTGCGGGYLPYRGLRIERVDGIDQVYGYDGFYVTKGPNEYDVWMSITNYHEDFGFGSGSGPVRYRSLAYAKMVADKYAAEHMG